MRQIFLCLAVVAMAASTSSAATVVGSSSDRIRTGGGSGSFDLYGSGNDDTFQSYGIVTFTLTEADFGGSYGGLLDANLNLTFNDRSFSDGTQFELFFTADDFAGAYAGLTYDVGSAPSGIDPSQFTSLSSLGVYDLGFDITDGSLGGTAFDYAVDFSSVETELANEIVAGSEFSIMLAAVNDADDITFSGVGNTFDPGDPALTINAVPEPSSFALLTLGLVAAARRRSRK